LDDATRSLQEAAILPLLRPDLYTGLRSPPRGILLYGPPGTGKTMLVKAVAHESQCILFACTASALTSKWHGEGEKLVRTLFRMASDVAPSILFFDEIDALLSSRKAEGEHEASRRFKTEFMVQVDGVASGGDGGGSSEGADDVQHRVLIIGCTNCPWDIDDAVMRRFQRRIYIPLPDAEARGALLRNMLKKASSDHSIKSSAQISQLIKLTEGYSCSDIAAIAQEAAFGPLRSLGGMEDIRVTRTQDVRPIDLNDFKDAISRSKKSVTSGLLAKYDAWEKEQMSR
jgi:SpoVK/Ycf46/Vps4 family AAA+-type ATPase